jgi:hypothetical protein
MVHGQKNIKLSAVCYSSVIRNAGWSCGGGILRAEKEPVAALVDELRNEANTKEMKEKK